MNVRSMQELQSSHLHTSFFQKTRAGGKAGETDIQQFGGGGLRITERPGLPCGSAVGQPHQVSTVRGHLPTVSTWWERTPAEEGLPLRQILLWHHLRFSALGLPPHKTKTFDLPVHCLLHSLLLPVWTVRTFAVSSQIVEYVTFLEKH